MGIISEVTTLLPQSINECYPLFREDTTITIRIRQRGSNIETQVIDQESGFSC